MQNLDNQVGQIAKSFAERPLGSLPSNAEANPREQEKANMLRSGQQVQHNSVIEKETKKNVENSESQLEDNENEVVKVSPFKPRMPYPSQLKNDKEIE